MTRDRKQWARRRHATPTRIREAITGACLVWLTVLCAACSSPRPFTPQDRITDEFDLTQLRFYLSTDTRLSRIKEIDTRDVSPQHQIRSRKKEIVEEIVVPSSLAGVLVGATGDTLLVSFESPLKGEERYLRFVREKSNGYVLITTPIRSKPPHDVVEYGGELYRLGKYGLKWSVFSRTFTFYPGERPHLEIKTKQVKNLVKYSRRVAGRKK